MSVPVGDDRLRELAEEFMHDVTGAASSPSAARLTALLQRVVAEHLTLLGRCREYVAPAAENPDVCYGYFVGGDPRNFSPDGDSTEEELAAHKADCEAWERGEQRSHKVRAEIDPNRSIAGQLKGSDSAVLERNEAGEIIGGHVHRAGYGMGVNTIEDAEAKALLDEMDRLLNWPGAARATKGETGGGR